MLFADVLRKKHAIVAPLAGITRPIIIYRIFNKLYQFSGAGHAIQNRREFGDDIDLPRFEPFPVVEKRNRRFPKQFSSTVGNLSFAIPPKATGAILSPAGMASEYRLGYSQETVRTAFR
jgi:hypothetical protein